MSTRAQARGLLVDVVPNDARDASLSLGMTGVGAGRSKGLF